MFYTLNLDLDDAHMDIIMCMCKLDHDVEVNRPKAENKFAPTNAIKL